jgi:hypothetical protein
MKKTISWLPVGVFAVVIAVVLIAQSIRIDFLKKEMSPADYIACVTVDTAIERAKESIKKLLELQQDPHAKGYGFWGRQSRNLYHHST